jgi:thioredoxin 1
MVVEIQDIDVLQTGNHLVEFYAPSCMPCRMMQPVLEEISKEFLDVKISKVEVTKNPQASQFYGVMSVPTIMILKDSKIKEVTKGLQSKATIKAMLEKHVRNGNGKHCS